MIPRYGCPVVAQHWTYASRLTHWLHTWQVASSATGRPWQLELADDPFEWDQFTERVAELEARYGHDVAAACEALRWCLKGSGQTDAAQWLHYGLCSSDVTDSGLWFTCRDVAGELVELASVAQHALLRLGLDQTPALHRTHGQPARVAGAGHRWHRHELNLGVGYHELAKATKRLKLPGFAGPTGVEGELSLVQRRRIRGELAGSEQGAGNAAAGQAVGRDDYVTWLQAVSRLATDCERFGRDVRLLAQTGEVIEGRDAEYRGSSSMPHKHNPTRSERLCGLAPVVRGLVSGYQEAAAECWDAHSLEHSSAERVCFPAVTELVGFMLTELYEIASTLEVSHEAQSGLVDSLETDSYAERNRLIREGADGGEAWVALRGDGTRVF